MEFANISESGSLANTSQPHHSKCVFSPFCKEAKSSDTFLYSFSSCSGFSFFQLSSTVELASAAAVVEDALALAKKKEKRSSAVRHVTAPPVPPAPPPLLPVLYIK